MGRAQRAPAPPRENLSKQRNSGLRLNSDFVATAVERTYGEGFLKVVKDPRSVLCRYLSPISGLSEM